MKLAEYMKPTILVVDDDPIARNLAVHVLKEKDYEIVAATDGVEGLKRFEEHSPALMLLDISMPRVNGLDLIRLLKEMDLVFQTKVLILSALGYREVVQEAISLGANDFVLKPFETNDLLMRVEKLLNQEEADFPPVAIQTMETESH